LAGFVEAVSFESATGLLQTFRRALTQAELSLVVIVTPLGDLVRF